MGGGKLAEHLSTYIESILNISYSILQKEEQNGCWGSLLLNYTVFSG